MYGNVGFVELCDFSQGFAVFIVLPVRIGIRIERDRDATARTLLQTHLHGYGMVL